MEQSMLEKLASLLVNYSIEAQKDQRILISGTTSSVDLVRAIYIEVLKAGAHPQVELSFEDQEYAFYKYAADHQLDRVDEARLHTYRTVDALVAVFPDLNPHSLTGIDALLKQRRTRANQPLSETIFTRWGGGELKWVGSGYPSPALAQEAHMALGEYTDFVFGAMRLDLDDPVAYWKDFSARQAEICRKLDAVSQIHIVGEDTDLTYSCQGRSWINCDGRNNFPDGEVFTGPVEDSVEGTIRFSYPGIFQGQEIEDIRLTFEKGRVVKASAAKGEALLHALLETDDGARYVGEAAIGTNEGITRFTKNMLFDEKMGGTIHMALGRGIPESGSVNHSAIHWDMLKDMKYGGTIEADGRVIYRDGRFVSGF